MEYSRGTTGKNIASLKCSVLTISLVLPKFEAQACRHDDKLLSYPRSNEHTTIVN